MNIYLLEFKEADYEENNSYIAYAESEESLKKLLDIKKNPQDCNKYNSNEYEDNIEKIELIGENKDIVKEYIIMKNNQGA